MESFSEKVRAYVYAFLVHVVVLASLFFGLFWAETAKPVATPGPMIEAEIVGVAAAPRPRPQSKPRPEPPKAAAPAPAPEPPKPEPPKPPEPKPTPTVQHNDKVDQEKIAEIADQKAEAAKKAQDEKHRQQQIELDEQKKRDEAEAKKKADIQKQLEDIRAERAKNDKKIKLEREKLAQLDDLSKQQATPAPKKAPAADVPEAETAKTGMNGNDTSLLAEYSSAIVKVVTDNWNRPETAPAGVRCAVHIVQIRGGTVLSASIASPCNADPITQESIKQAVMKAQPLPYKGYESVFQRDITFNFRYDGN